MLEAAVIGRPDERSAETPVAVLVAAPGADLSLAAGQEWCRPRLAGDQVPRAVVLLEVLPRNASGKMVRSVLRTDHTS